MCIVSRIKEMRFEDCVITSSECDVICGPDFLGTKFVKFVKCGFGNKKCVSIFGRLGRRFGSQNARKICMWVKLE